MPTNSRRRIPQLEYCNRAMFGDVKLTHQPTNPCPFIMETPLALDFPLMVRPNTPKTWNNRRRASDLVDELLVDIYRHVGRSNTTSESHTSFAMHENLQLLHFKGVGELAALVEGLEKHVARAGCALVRRLKRRDALRRQQDAHCDVISGQLVKRSGSEEEALRFSVQPAAGESGFAQWSAAMKMVAQLQGGIPPEFRSRLWLNLAERHLAARGVDWPAAERSCFSEWSHPADGELGVQIVKDLHRTGCSLFCGKDGLENQALLKKVLLAYARWNKAVGYCQGFNMLAALILQVTDKCEADALKLMIYLIEGVLPDSYFADSLRGLSVDMAVFRELLRARLPRLSRHLDTLQSAAKEGTASYEPPLTNVFTMQWFLTLFCNCLPQPTVLRVWDLIMLEGNEILLRTALAIWKILADRILTVKSADEFYCMMGVLTRELLEFNLIDGNALIKSIVQIGPLTELPNLREHYLYNITPWGAPAHRQVDRQVHLYPKDRLVLDISALKKQYAKLKQRQRQAHIIFSAAISRQPGPSAPTAMNHLLLGKSALVPAKRLAPAKPGSIPPARPPSTLHWKDAPRCDSSSSSDTELCDEESDDSDGDETISQLPNDNLMINNDNIAAAAIEEPIANTIDVCNDATPSLSSVATDDEDDSVDFETFLNDRVAFLKEKESPEIDQVPAASFARRNSERALQIIKENSLILHRIMQCQSRLSPPIVGAKEEVEEARAIVAPSIDSTLFSWMEELETKGVEVEEKESPEYGSRYSSILEKSRNLDEKYNSLILNSSVTVPSFSSDDDVVVPDLLICDSEVVTSPTTMVGSFSNSLLKSPDQSDSSTRSKSPSPVKSPSHVFNPFPVSLSSRQNKEVPFKLGLYKK